jgi:hypothetical protein
LSGKTIVTTKVNVAVNQPIASGNLTFAELDEKEVEFAITVLSRTAPLKQVLVDCQGMMQPSIYPEIRYGNVC